MQIMRAKMRVNNVERSDNSNSETLHLSAVCKSEGYPADGSDENNSFARWTPSAEMKITVTNPELFGKFRVGQEFYVDFTPAN